MRATATPEQRQAAKRQIIGYIKHGASVQEARMAAAVPMHRTTVYRLLQRIQTQGETACSDGRHGHPIKVRGEVRTFLIDFCQTSPIVSSSGVQTALQERFGITISVSQINRFRKALGLRGEGKPREKKALNPSVS
jgi:transposase